MRTGKVVVLGTLAGLAIGAIAGILFAPEKGSKIRKQIKDRSKGYMDDLKSRLDKFRTSVAGKFESAKGEAENLADRGKAKYDDVKKEAKNAASDFKHTAV